MVWGIKRDWIYPRRWIITRDGHDAGSISLQDELYDPDTVLAAIVEVLERDSQVGAF
jgi:hypothetical protein